MKKRSKAGSPQGFTMIEVIAVLMVVGVIAAIAINRVMSTTVTTRVAQESVIKNHIRYAQATALKQGTMWGIKCDGTDYWLFRTNAPDTVTNQIPLPGESIAKIRLADKNITANAFTVFFDANGRPYRAYTDAVTNTPVSAADPLSITVNSVPAGTAVTIGITPETGFMP
jgi:prepilin-type N-terminal cleavage/methylation domain-containing protein